MTNGNDFAGKGVRGFRRMSGDMESFTDGLTKREHFALTILPSLIALESDALAKGECHDAVLYADALIEALNREERRAT